MMGEINFHSASPFKSVHFAMLRKDNSLSKVRFLGTLDTFLSLQLSSGK
jgi:hypothetical protein